MKHTLVAAFDGPTEADRAKADLMSRGISQTHIHMAASNSADIQDYDTSDTGSEYRDDERGESKISQFFKSLFGSDSEDRRYADTYPEAVRRGSSVIAVDVDDDEEMRRAIEALESNGAIDIDERSATWGSSGSETSALGGATGTSAGEERTIPVIEEELKVGKRERSAGRVRVVSRIEERPVEETVSLREEHVDIDRRPVDRDATGSELSGMGEQSMEFRETREEPVVQKSAKVVEEVEVKKDTTRRDETVRDTVRGTHVDIERDDDSRPR